MQEHIPGLEILTVHRDTGSYSIAFCVLCDREIRQWKYQTGVSAWGHLIGPDTILGICIDSEIGK